MKVLHCINSMITGGAEVLLLKSIEKFRELYPESVHHVVTLFEKGDLYDRLPAGVHRFHLGYSAIKFPIVLVTLRKYIRQNAIDIVHSHLYEATIVSRLAVPSGVKLISTYHNGFHNPSVELYSAKRYFVDKLTFRQKYFTLFVSNAVKDQILGTMPVKRYQVLPNFPSHEFKPVYRYRNDTSLKMVSVGGLKQIKNYPLAIEALGALKEYDITLDIYGDGELREDLQKLISTSGANVRLMGDVHITPQLLSGYDLFLMTSKSEGMSISLLEAIATGLPSLLNDLDMLRETAKDCALYYRENSVDDLRKKLSDILQKKNILQLLSDHAKKVSEDYSDEKYVRTLHGIYQTQMKN